MSDLSDFLENTLVNLVYKGTAYAGQSTVYLALHTSAGASESNAAWAATELVPGTATGYLRTAVASAVWGTATDGLLTNVSLITFPVAGASWGTVTHWSTWSASGVGAGNMLHKAALITPRAVPNGDQFQFAIGNCTVGFA